MMQLIQDVLEKHLRKCNTRMEIKLEHISQEFELLAVKLHDLLSVCHLKIMARK